MKKIAGIYAAALLIPFLSTGIAYGEKADDYKYEETKVLVKMVRDACRLIETKGEAALPEFKKPVSIWRHGDMYIFILDTEGNMLVHPEPALEGKNQLALKDKEGKPVIRQIISGVVTYPDKNEDWEHYLWPRFKGNPESWKTTFARLAQAPSGKKYIVASGLYDMKMEKCFLMDLVDAAARLVEEKGRDAFAVLRDKSGPFIFKNTYVFVDLPDGLELVNPAFPQLESVNMMDYKDSLGNYMVREYIRVALSRGSGWVTYMWPKPGETTPSPKFTYVKKSVHDKEVFIVGSGQYFE